MLIFANPFSEDGGRALFAKGGSDVNKWCRSNVLLPDLPWVLEEISDDGVLIISGLYMVRVSLMSCFVFCEW